MKISQHATLTTGHLDRKLWDIQWETDRISQQISCHWQQRAV